MIIDTEKFASREHHPEIGRDAYKQKITSDVLFPIGEKVEHPDEVEIFYVTSNSEISLAWIEQCLPEEIQGLVALVEKAFALYRDEENDNLILENLSDEVIGFPADFADAFRREGYIPFFEIQAIYLCPDDNAVFFAGRTDIDGHLDEHGVTVKVSGSDVEIGEASEFWTHYTA